MVFSAILFYVLAAVIVISAIMSARSTNLVHSAFFMILSFLGIAGIYLTLSADFLAVVQVLIYVGAISVLMVFGVMLTRRGNIKESNLFNKYRVAATVVACALFVVMAGSAVMTQWKLSDVAPPETTVEQIAALLMGDYVIPFEAAGVMLLMALIGSIIIGKGVKSSK